MTTPQAFTKLKQEAAAQQQQQQRCAIPFCPRLTMRSAGVGFDAYHCEYHRARLARHGHFEHPTLRAADLRPYVETAKRWLKAELASGNIRVRYALTAISGLMDTAGRAPPATDIKRWSAEAKATACFARLREANVTPDSLMATAMGVAAYLADDTWAPQSREFFLVQLSKAIHRRASGTHKRYEYPVGKVVKGGGGASTTTILYDGSTTTLETHTYPRSQGQVLREIGRSIDEACGDIAEAQREAIIAAKDARYERHPCHTPGYEPEWRKKDRAKHEAAARKRAEAKRQQLDAGSTALRRALGYR